MRKTPQENFVSRKRLLQVRRKAKSRFARACRVLPSSDPDRSSKKRMGLLLHLMGLQDWASSSTSLNNVVAHSFPVPRGPMPHTASTSSHFASLPDRGGSMPPISIGQSGSPAAETSAGYRE